MGEIRLKRKKVYYIHDLQSGYSIGSENLGNDVVEMDSCAEEDFRRVMRQTVRRRLSQTLAMRKTIIDAK